MVPEGVRICMQFIDVSAQYRAYQPDIDQAMAAVLAAGQYVLGPEVQTLEERLAKRLGRRHCISCGSGTDALLVSLMAHGIGPGDEVITVPFTWISTAEVIELVGATTVFVDIEPDYFCMDLAACEAAITDRTKAIIPVSLFGQMPDYTALRALAEPRGIAVIEDGAQSFGAMRDGVASCGVPGTIGCTSFFPTKPLSCFGEGGAIFVDDDQVALGLRQIRTHGSIDRTGHHRIGINGRLETVQAAILLAKLPHFDAEIASRQRLAKRYGDALTGLVTVPPVVADGSHVYAQYTIRVPDRDRIQAALRERDIPTAIYYRRGLNEEPAFAHVSVAPGSLPVCEQACGEVLSLPMYPWLPESDQDQVIGAIREVVGA